MLTPPRVLGLITAAYSVAIGLKPVLLVADESRLAAVLTAAAADPGRRVCIGLFAAGWATLCAVSARWAG